MSHLIRRSTALIAAGCALTTAAFVAASPAGAASHRKTAYFHTTAKRFVAGPVTVRPGVVQLHNSGKHEIVLFSKKSAGADKLTTDLRKNFLKTFRDFNIRGVIAPHRSIFLRLHRGTLFMFDGMRQHYPANSIHTVSVAGKTWNASLSKSRAITMTGHNILKVPANAARNTLFHVINNSGKTQDIGLLRISPQTPLSDVQAAAANPTDDNLAKLKVTGGLDLAELAPHQTLWTRVDSPKGNGLVMAVTISGKNISMFGKGTLGAIHFG